MPEYSTKSEIPLDNRSYSVYAPEIDDRELRTKEQNISDFLTYAVPATVAGFANTVSDSLGFTSGDEYGEMLKTYLPPLGHYYQRNKEWAQTTGDLTGMLFTGSLGLQAFRAEGVVARLVGANKSRILGSLFSSASKRNKIIEELRARDRFLSDVSHGTINLLADPKRRELVKQARIAGVSNIVKENIAFELGVLATMNESQTLYPDEFSAAEIVALNSVLPGVAGVGSLLRTNRMVRASAQAVAHDATSALNPQRLPVDLTTSRPGQRDISLTVDAVASSAAKQMKQEIEVSTVAERDIGISNFERAGREYEADARKHIENLGRDVLVKTRIEGQQLTNQVIPDVSQVDTVINALEKEPTIMLGAYSVEEVPGSIAAMQGKFTLQAKTAEKIQNDILNINETIGSLAAKGGDTAELTARRAELEATRDLVNSTEMFVIEPNGTMVLASTRKPLFMDAGNEVYMKSRAIERRTADEPQRYTLQLPADPVYRSKSATVAFGEDGLFTILSKQPKTVAGIDPKGITTPLTGDIANRFEGLSLYQRSGAYRLMQEAVEKYDIEKSPILQLNDKSHHTQLDFALALQKRYGNRVTDKINIPKSWKGTDDIELASLHSKFNEYRRLRQVLDAGAGSTFRLRPELQLHLDDLSKMLNLPSDPGELHPVLRVFEELYIEGGEAGLKDVFRTTEHFRRQLQEDAFLGRRELTSFLNRKVELDGGLLDIPVSNRPVMVLKRPVSDELYTRRGVEIAAQEQRTRTLNELHTADKYGANLVKITSDTINSQLPTVTVAQDVGSLIEGGQFGTGLFTTQAKAIGENPTLQALQQIERLTDKAHRNAVKQIFDPAATVWSKLRHPGKKADLETLNLFVHARRQDWDLEEGFTQHAASGKWSVALKYSKRNRDKFREFYGREMPDPKDAGPTLLPSPVGGKRGSLDYQPLLMSDLARAGVEQITRISNIVLDNTNHLRRIAGRGPINRKSHHIPARGFLGLETVYLADETGQITATIAGRSQREAEQLAREEIAASGKTLHIRTRKDIDKYFDMRDEAFERLLDFSDPLNQTGRARGTSVGYRVQTGEEPLEDIVTSLERNLESILRRTRAAYFEPQINYIRKLHGISASEASKKGQTIYQQYLSSMFGNPTINPNDIVGRTYFTLESGYDEILGVLHDRVFSKNRIADRLSKSEKAKYEALDKQLGEWNPYKSAAEYAENTFRLTPPPRMKQHFALINEITSALTLRIFETGHPILTLTSLAATTPSVIRGLKKSPFETAEQHAARIGAFGYKLPKSDDVVFSPARVLSTAMHDMFTPEGHAIWKEASERGFMDQQVAEIFGTLTHPKEGYVEGLVREGVRITSFLSDTSEKLARGISFMVGASFAKRALGMTNKDHIFAFAHRFANENIGDYAPNNRPRVFQGAVGMPLGLFMTFMQNYYQRMFNYIENGQTRALVTQFAAQASVFGGSTVPGFKQFSEIFASNYDGSSNLVDGMENRFGTPFTEAFLYGTLSNLPKWLGADDGIALYTRGDTSIRSLPSIFSLSDTPVVAAGQAALDAASQAIGLIREKGMLNDKDIAELLSQYSISRVVRNAATLYTGYSVDKRGQVISDDVYSTIGLLARGMSLRPMQEARSVEASYRNRSAELSRRARLEVLRRDVRTSIRDGSLDKNLDRIVSNYVKYGGSIERFPQWLIEQSLRAKVDKTQLEFQEKLKSGKHAEALRLLHVMDPLLTEDEFEVK